MKSFRNLMSRLPVVTLKYKDYIFELVIILNKS